MCGRYTLRKGKDIAVQFHIDDCLAEISPRYNAAPGQMLPVIYQQQGKTVLEVMRWGLVPSWSPSLDTRYTTINARSEEILEKPAYRQPVRTQRCVVPCDGYYEWKKQGAANRPFFIHMRDDALFYVAGIYDIYHKQDGTALKTFSMITTRANELIAPIHHRMDVIVPESEIFRWLDPQMTDNKVIQAYFEPASGDTMELYPVSRKVNNSRIDEPDLILPDTGEEQQTLL